MSLPSYEEIVERLMLPPTGLNREAVTIKARPSRRGIRRFLMASAEATPSRSTGWLRLWRNIQMTQQWLLFLSIRVPNEAWDEDRVRLRYLLSSPEDNEEWRKAERWANR